MHPAGTIYVTSYIGCFFGKLNRCFRKNGRTTVPSSAHTRLTICSEKLQDGYPPKYPPRFCWTELILAMAFSILVNFA